MRQSVPPVPHRRLPLLLSLPAPPSGLSLLSVFHAPLSFPPKQSFLLFSSLSLLPLPSPSLYHCLFPTPSTFPLYSILPRACVPQLPRIDYCRCPGWDPLPHCRSASTFCCSILNTHWLPSALPCPRAFPCSPPVRLLLHIPHLAFLRARCACKRTGCFGCANTDWVACRAIAAPLPCTRLHWPKSFPYIFPTNG
jgi:hypothetical protein